MPAVRRILRLSRRDIKLLSVALLVVIRVRILLWRKAHKDLRRMIDSHPSMPDPLAQGVSRRDLAEVAWSVRNAARLVPGATCLTQASAGQILLARRGHASTVRLSVPAKSAAMGRLAPHAWLISDDVIVLGGSVTDYAQHRALHDFSVPKVP